MADDSLAVLLRTHTGMSDVDDLLAVCAGLADEDCATYLQAFISDGDTADAVAAQIVAARSGGEQTTGATTTETTSPSPSLVTGKKGEVEEKTCLGEVAAELEVVQRSGLDSDDEGVASDDEEEGEEEA